MALACKCDRCGKLYISYRMPVRKYKVNGIITIDRSNDNSSYMKQEYIDLCPDCMETFSKWLNYFKEKKDDRND